MLEGIIPVWKEAGMTSHDAVYKIRKILKIKKVGHSGTLDPDVSGVLPVCVGSATKIVDHLVESKKEYMGEVTLGYSTTTEDASGDIVETKRVSNPPTTKEIDQALEQLTGEITQIPPMFSAIRIDGKRLYEYAREGLVIDRPGRNVWIHSYERTSTPVYNEEEGTLSFRFKAVCSKGTYIRTLAVDTGGLLGYPAHMSFLTRTESGTFKKEECFTVSQVKDLYDHGQIAHAFYPLERALSDYPFVEITRSQWEKVQNGYIFLKTEFASGTQPFVLFYEGLPVAIYHKHPTKPELVKPMKMIRTSL